MISTDAIQAARRIKNELALGFPVGALSKNDIVLVVGAFLETDVTVPDEPLQEVASVAPDSMLSRVEASIAVPVSGHLRKAIIRSGKSANSISKISGVPQPTITRFLNGADMKASTIDKLAAHFQMELRTAELRGDTEMIQVVRQADSDAGRDLVVGSTPDRVALHNEVLPNANGTDSRCNSDPNQLHSSMEHGDRWLNRSEAAEFLGVQQHTLAAWAYRGGYVKFVKVGRCVKYRLSDLQAFVAANTVTKASDYQGAHA